jgi:serine protease Do
MKKIHKMVAVVAMAGTSILAWEGGSALIQNVQFAKAEQNVASSREQLEKVEDLSTVFRNVGEVMNPSVVEIDVTKMVKGVRQQFGPGDGNDPLRRFFRDHGMNNGAPDDQGDNGNSNGNGDENNDAPDDGPGYPEQGTGSGVIMEVDGSDGYIMTNNHVAGDATKLTVTLSDGRQIQGTTIGHDAKADLAIVRIKADHLIPAKWGDSDLMDRGDWVLAFGSPLRYVGSMTHGIVSATHRQTNVDGSGGILGPNGYENFIQVDCPINPGNSGGPLVNIHGEVIGINTAIASQNGGFQGIGFAIPSNEAKSMYAMLKEKGKVTRGWLGVGIEDVRREPELAKNIGYTPITGIIVTQVFRGTPAFGKLEPDDVITSLNGKTVANVEELREQIAIIAPGTDATLHVYRNSKEEDVTIKVGEQPESPLAMAEGGRGELQRPHNSQGAESIGVRLSDVTPELATKYELGDVHDGALVTGVRQNSPATDQLQEGDLITRVDGHRVTDANSAGDLLGKADLDKGVRLNITNRMGDGIVFIHNQK